MPVLKFEFDNEEAMEHFKTCLCNCGEQDYWDYMSNREGENPEGDIEIREMNPGVSVYVPPRYAHRSINTSDIEPLISFYTFRADAGHDYKTIETKGFRKLVVEKDGKPELIDNPK